MKSNNLREAFDKALSDALRKDPETAESIWQAILNIGYNEWQKHSHEQAHLHLPEHPFALIFPPTFL